MIDLLFNEVFKEIELEGNLQLRYAISNFGRLVSYTRRIKDGRLLKGSILEGFRVLNYKVREGDKVLNKHLFFYKKVGEKFLRKLKSQDHLIHLDHNLSNDQVSNLKWVTTEEKMIHLKTSPKVIEAKQKLWEFNQTRDGQKLTITKVMALKKLLANPKINMRNKQIATKFGISEMQLYRIKTGQNWSQVQI